MLNFFQNNFSKNRQNSLEFVHFIRLVKYKRDNNYKQF